uniref:Kazal-like domain-containing protein n=1 Tax=Seriola lalandi dorsalis TaxID=1841481 RepID=A0A3B4Y0R1_SERLL
LVLTAIDTKSRICVSVLPHIERERKRTVTPPCPLNYSPVCGSNGQTYANECALCADRLADNADILIVKEGPC